MKSPQKFLLIACSSLLIIGLNWQLPLMLSQSAHSITLPYGKSLPTGVEKEEIPENDILEILAAAGTTTDSSDALPIAAGDRVSMFIEADRLYRQGDFEAAEQIYRQVKPEFETSTWAELPEPIYEAEALTPENFSLWESAQVAIENGDEDLAIQALQPLYNSQPEFILGTLKLAEMMQAEDQEEEAIAVLEQAAVLYPNSAEIVMAQVLALAEEDEHLEASIAAREFALLNLDHPQAPEFQELAEDEFKKFSRSRRRRGFFSGIVNLGVRLLTGDVPWESWDSTIETAQMVRLMLGGESEFGTAIARDYQQQLTLVEDTEVVDYVTQLGLEVARLMGRDFDYEFYVVQDNTMNASALPGGKIFVNTGAILATHSQAELAGVLAHEAAHSVLSHGIQSFFRDDLLSRLSDEIPMGEFVTGLLSLHYSRKQERQADILGNRALATAGYAADGLRNFMVSLGQQEGSDNSLLSTLGLDRYLSSHPLSDSRVEYLEGLIQRNGYNRYALEGVDRHREVQAKLS